MDGAVKLEQVHVGLKEGRPLLQTVDRQMVSGAHIRFLPFPHRTEVAEGDSCSRRFSLTKGGKQFMLCPKNERTVSVYLGLFC
jgi:hypothetical protein